MTYVRRQIKLVVSEDANSRKILINRGDSETRFDSLDVLAEVELAKKTISLPASNVDLMQGTTIQLARILYIETDTELLIKLDSLSDTGFKVKPIDTGDSDGRGILYLEGSFTHAYVTPVGSTGEATVLVGVVGA